MQNYLASMQDGFAPNLKVCSLKSELFNLAVSYAGKKIDVVFTDGDYKRLGKIVIGALKNACADYSVMIIECSRGHKTPKIDYDGDVVFALGGEELLSVAGYYASQMKIPYHTFITKPLIGFMLNGVVKCNVTGITREYKITPPKSVVFDNDVLSMATQSVFAEEYVKIASLLLTLVDYKFKVLLTGDTFNAERYSQIRKIISFVLGISKFTNPKEVLIFASFVLSIESEFGEVLSSSAVDDYVEALNVYAPNAQKGAKILTAFSRLVEVYCMFFANDFSRLLCAPNYNKDIELFESQTGANCDFLYENLKVPSSKRLYLITEVVNKTRDGFLSDLKSILSIINEISSEYNSFNKTTKKIEKVSFEQKLNALRLAPYYSKTPTALTVVRDLGLIELVK